MPDFVILALDIAIAALDVTPAHVLLTVDTDALPADGTVTDASSGVTYQVRQ